MKKKIHFYSIKDEYGNFSNFSNFPILMEGEIWSTSEHYFQASKFEDVKLKEKIRLLKSPMKAAKEGRKRKYLLKPDWEKIKEEVMCNALVAKFLQHPELRTELLNTKDAIIFEHTKNDNYWGDGGDGSGLNRLGELLMKVREYLFTINDDINLVLPPWIPFKNVNENDMFWRMGLGEDYLYVWSRFYLELENKDEYHIQFPEPNDWKGFYTD